MLRRGTPQCAKSIPTLPATAPLSQLAGSCGTQSRPGLPAGAWPPNIVSLTLCLWGLLRPQRPRP
eukprot:6463854-Amphidinium_carterae.4